MITLQGQPYVFGGQNYAHTVLNTVYTFDTTSKWVQRKPMITQLWQHAAAATDTNTGMVCGGMTGLSVGSTAVQCYTYTIKHMRQATLIQFSLKNVIALRQGARNQTAQTNHTGLLLRFR
jgi:hypothetical protein